MTKLAVFAAAVAGASAVTIPTKPLPTGAPKLPLNLFETKEVHTLSLQDITDLVFNHTGQSHPPPEPEIKFSTFAAADSCSSSTRMEWHDSSDQTKQNFVDAVKCLLGKPSAGNYPGSKNRYEDFVQVHQTNTDNVHNNRKFLVWHRYFLWTFEKELRNTCGFTDSVPWFDETKYAGRFSQSSIFSSRWFGGINLHGDCVTDGQFANLALNVGPGTAATNQYHCLARNGDASQTQNTNSDIVNGCTALTDYQDFAKCCEQGAHAYGHNGIGSVMRDVYASPGDPVFWLHHGFVDRHFRIWQNNDPNRVNYIDGNGPNNQPLTMDTTIYMNGLGPDVKVRDIMNTLSGTNIGGSQFCYRYNY